MMISSVEAIRVESRQQTLDNGGPPVYGSLQSLEGMSSQEIGIPCSWVGALVAGSQAKQ